MVFYQLLCLCQEVSGEGVSDHSKCTTAGGETAPGMALPAPWLSGLSNILEVSQLQAVQALIVRKWSIRRIARILGVNRHTLQKLATLPGADSPATPWVLANGLPCSGSASS